MTSKANRNAETMRRCIQDRLRLNDAVRHRIRARWRDGLDTYAIAVELGLNEATVHNVVKRQSGPGVRQYRKEA